MCLPSPIKTATEWAVVVTLGSIIAICDIVIIVLMLSAFVYYGKIISRPLNVVTDKLVGCDVKLRWINNTRRFGAGIEYRMVFSPNGEYTVATRGYYETEYQDTTLYNASSAGDEFFVVLDKPVNGRVLKVYSLRRYDRERK